MKIFKGTLSVLLALLLLCGVLAPAYAEEVALTIPAQPAQTRGARLADAAATLSERDANTLLALLDETSRRLQFDIVIVTGNTLGSRTMQEFADDYYDYNGFGYGPRKDGCLLLVQPKTPSWYVSTRGFGVNALDSSYFISLLKNDAFQTSLTAGKYKDAFDRFVLLTEAFLTEANGGHPYSDAHPYTGAFEGKTFGEPVWSWSDDGTATAVFTSTDGSDAVTVIATPAAGTVTAADGKNGTIVYTAVVTFDGKLYTDTHTKAASLTYKEPTWQWEDETVARATFVSTDGSDKVSVSALASEGAIKSAPGKDGATVYTATVTFGGKTYTNSYTVAAPALTYKEPTWQWEDETVARATFVSTDGSDKVSVSALASEGAIKSAPGKDGATVYTATVTFGGKTYTNSYTVAAPTLTYKDPVWQWESTSLARATFVSTDGSSKLSASAQAEDNSITSSKKANGDIVYTATVTFNGKTYTDTYVVSAPAYGKPTWSWDGVKSAKATFVSTDGSYFRTLTVTADKGGITSKTSGTCGTNGKTVYTAKVTFGGKTYTDKKSVALAHKWKTSLTRATTKAAGTKTFICTVCGKKVTNPIAKIAKISLSKTRVTYNGKVQTPKVTVKDANGKTLKKNKAYTVSYAAGRKDLGVYAVKVTFKGNYSGTKTLKFKILPTAPANVTATPGDGKATIKWDAVPGAQQYKVYCMREGGKSFFLAATTRNPAAEIGSLKNGTTYLFKVKAVTVVDGKETASAACKAVRVTPAAAAPAQTAA